MRLFGWVGRRLSTSLMYAHGSCPLMRADWMRLMTAAARWPAVSVWGHHFDCVSVSAGLGAARASLRAGSRKRKATWHTPLHGHQKLTQRLGKENQARWHHALVRR